MEARVQRLMIEIHSVVYFLNTPIFRRETYSTSILLVRQTIMKTSAYEVDGGHYPPPLPTHHPTLNLTTEVPLPTRQSSTSPPPLDLTLIFLFTT